LPFGFARLADPRSDARTPRCTAGGVLMEHYAPLREGPPLPIGLRRCRGAPQAGWRAHATVTRQSTNQTTRSARPPHTAVRLWLHTQLLTQLLYVCVQQCRAPLQGNSHGMRRMRVRGPRLYSHATHALGGARVRWSRAYTSGLTRRLALTRLGGIDERHELTALCQQLEQVDNEGHVVVLAAAVLHLPLL